MHTTSSRASLPPTSCRAAWRRLLQPSQQPPLFRVASSYAGFTQNMRLKSAEAEGPPPPPPLKQRGLPALLASAPFGRSRRRRFHKSKHRPAARGRILTVADAERAQRWPLRRSICGTKNWVTILERERERPVGRPICCLALAGRRPRPEGTLGVGAE